jgi:hypothetical protein
VTPGEQFAEAGNSLIKGIQQIQFLVHRPVPVPMGMATEEYLMKERDKIAEVCERLVGPYKIIIADLSRGTK